MIALIALGSNLADRLEQLRQAAAALGALGEVVACSRIYETAPMYVTDQPAFLNAAVALRTSLDGSRLLEGLLGIERQLGRVRAVARGPRLIDLDLLALDGQIVELPELSVPHPGIAERAFVLAPLLDVAPGWIHPRLGRTVTELASGLEMPPAIEESLC